VLTQSCTKFHFLTVSSKAFEHVPNFSGCKLKNIAGFRLEIQKKELATSSEKWRFHT